MWRSSRAGLLACLLCTLAQAAAEPVQDVWLRSPSTAAGVAEIRPEVHAVEIDDREVVVRSAGISLLFLGSLQARPETAEPVGKFEFRIPRFPQPETQAATTLPAGIIGAFTNGVPIYNPLEGASWQNQNLWHYDNIRGGTGGSELLDNLLRDSSRHSPILGYALDGYPIYGPWAAGAAMRSSYRLRAIARRSQWPDGTTLTPGQEGPPVNAEYPLGTFAEDYEYVRGWGDLDEHNGRFAVTPEYPRGIYAYFLSADQHGKLAFPYLPAGTYYGKVAPESLASVAPAAGRAVRLAFRVTIGAETIRHLEYVHEKPMHLLIVSDDLAEFAHTHPELSASGAFEVLHAFPHGGRYHLYLDYTAPGWGQKVEAFTLDVAGEPRKPEPLVESHCLTSEQEGMSVTLSAAGPLEAGKDIELSFALSVSDLEPYLGAWGHFVLIDETKRTFIHAHPMEAAAPQAQHVHSVLVGASPDSIRVPVNFPGAGLYKLWAQFQRNGKVLVFPFTLRVKESGAEPAPVTIPSDAIRVGVSSSGFSPARIQAPAGRKVKIAFVRDRQPNCASKIVFPTAGVSGALAPGGVLIVEVPVPETGELAFSCGMGMYRGALIAR